MQTIDKNWSFVGNTHNMAQSLIVQKALALMILQSLNISVHSESFMHQ